MRTPMPKSGEFVLISGDEDEVLSKVNEILSEGGKLAGNMLAIDKGHYYRFYQPMILKIIIKRN